MNYVMGKHVIQFHVRNRCSNEGSERYFGFFFFEDDGVQRVSITLGKWNPETHIEWVNTNLKRKSTGNTKQRQYAFTWRLFFC